MAKFRIAQEIGGSHKFDVEKDGRTVTAYHHYKYAPGDIADSDQVPQGDRLFAKLVKLGYAAPV